MNRSRFFEVPRTRHVTSEGVVELPILYYDASNVVALFSTDPSAAASMLEPHGLVPMRFRGRAVVALSFFEYRVSSVGAYNEVGTAIFAKRAGAKLRWATSGAFVVDLPVTTRAANAAGRELWGYPKFVTTISFHRAGRDVVSSVVDPGGGGAIVTLSGRMGPAAPMPPVSFATFTAHEGSVLRTEIDVRGRNELHAPGTVRLHDGTSQHPMAKNLRALGITDARPFALVCNDHFAARLHAGSVARNLLAHRADAAQVAPAARA